MAQASSDAGYSGKPLPKKLGIKPGQRLAFVSAPAGYVASVIGDDPHETALDTTDPFDLIQFFATSREELAAALPALKNALAKDGALWVSWPKKASGVASDLSENIVREIALAAGVVDVKVCAIDNIWSGLKLVYRLKDR